MALPFKSSSFPQPPLQVHFGEDGNHSLEVSLIGDHPPQFTTSDGAGASRSKTLPVAPHSADLPWMRDDAGIEDEDWSAGQSGEEGDDAQVGDLQRGNDRIRRGGSARVDSSRARQSDADAEFDDREEDSGAEAGTGREGDQEEADIMLGDSRNRTGEEGAGMSRRTVAQVWKDTMERRITARSELVSFERLAGKRKEPDFEGRKPSEDRNQAIFIKKQEDRSMNLKETLSMSQANLDPEDGNYNNTGGQEGSFSLYDPSSGIQGSGEEEDRAELLEEEKAGASEEEKTGASDEVNTGTSEEEKNGQAEMEKVRKVGKAGQKRKASLTSVSGASNGDGTVVKKAKKKTINVWAKTSSRKGGKKNSSKNGAQQNIASEDCVYLTPVYRNQDKVEDGPNLPILLSRYHKAEKIELTLDRLSAGSTKGYRMARATRGVTDGAWYFEIIVEKLGPTGHTRLGWSTERGDVQAPVGYDKNSYAYRDVDGSKVHMAVREPYGEAYVEGDVIGFYINLPHGAELAPKPPPIVSYKGQPWVQEAKEEPPKIVPGSEISFFRNGVCQGVAFKDINAGRYYPAASMYTLPNEPNCTVRFNFGPDFKLPPVDIGNRPPPQAMFCAPYCGLDGREVVPGSWGGEAYSARVPPSAESQKFVETG